MSQKESSNVAVEDKETPAETQVSTATELHEKALRTDENSPEFKAAVAEAVRTQFEVTSWKPKATVKFIVDFASGQKTLVKHLDTMDLVRNKLLREMDTFSKKLFPAKYDEQGTPVDAAGNEVGVVALMEEPEKRVKFMDLMNRLMAAASVEPKIVNDYVALIDSSFAKELGVELSNDDEKIDVYGYQIEGIENQIKVFGKPVPVLKDNEVYAGVISFADRMQFFQEINKPLAMIEPFRGSTTSVPHVERRKRNGSPTE
jgi:hypothetical protein